MSRPSIRQNILLRSVQRLLDEDEQVESVAMLSTRHRWYVPYAAFAAVVMYIAVSVSGIESTLSRAVLVVCGMGVAGIATTNYSVLAKTSHGLVLCRSSRIRQYAKEVKTRLAANTPLDMVGSTVITSDWRVDGVIYTTTKRWEATMRLLAGAAA